MIDCLINYLSHDITRIVIAPLLALFSQPKYRYFAWIVALELVVSSVFAQALIRFNLSSDVYYDIVLLFNSLLFFHLLIYKARFSTVWHKRHLDFYTGAGCMLFLVGAIYYMCIIGQYLSNITYEVSRTTFVSGYSVFMILLQVCKFVLLIRVIDFDRMAQRFRFSPDSGFSFLPWRYNYRLLLSKIMQRTDKTSQDYT